MFKFKYKGKIFSIEERLKRNLDKRILPDLKKRDKDVVWIVDGQERTGKSVFAQGNLAAYLGYCLGKIVKLEDICMTPIEFRERVEKCPKNSIVIYDEAHRGMGSSSSLSEVNKILKDMMMEMGQKNLAVIVTLPSFFLLDKYIPLFRARGLFHIYERKGRRGNWVYFNKKKMIRLYMMGKKTLDYNCMHWPQFRGQFYDDYVVDEKEYKAKKLKSFKDKPRYTKAEVYISQRNKLLWSLWKEFGISVPNLAKLCENNEINLKESVITEIIREFKETYGFERIRTTQNKYISTSKVQEEKNNVVEEEEKEEKEEIEPD